MQAYSGGPLQNCTSGSPVESQKEREPGDTAETESISGTGSA